MIHRALLIATLLISGPLAAGGDEVEGRKSLIERCIDALGEADSIHVANGLLKPGWSKAHVNATSIGSYVTVTFSRAEETKNSGDGYIYDDSIIYCLIKNESEVAHLMSPEKNKDALRMTDLVVLDEEYEKGVFDEIVDGVRKGVDVYAYDTFFSISGRTIKKTSETKVKKLDPQDYLND